MPDAGGGDQHNTLGQNPGACETERRKTKQSGQNTVKRLGNEFSSIIQYRYQTADKKPDVKIFRRTSRIAVI